MESMQATRNTWVTRCPNCKTDFRVSLKHLQAAHGSVRCGSCLQIFRAPEHLASGKLPSELLKTLTPTSSTTTARPGSHARQHIAKPQPEPNELIHDPANNNDDEQPDQFRARNILSKLEKDTGLRNETPARPSADEPHPQAEPTAATKTVKPKAQLQTLEDSLVELHYTERRHWKPILLWGCLNIAAILTLTGQYLFFHFDTLALKDNWRPFFAASCNILNCALPGKSDISQIQTSHLVIRNTSDYENTLSVDAIINNLARFSQPFPLIELTFTNIRGTIVASRQFSPAEYLAGELAGTRLIPPEQPVHLSLQIIDPGQEATSYQLSFYPNPSP